MPAEHRLTRVNASRRSCVRLASMSVVNRLLAGAVCFLWFLSSRAVELETRNFALRVSPETGAAELVDKTAGVTWRSQRARFGEVTLTVNGKPLRVSLGKCEATSDRNQLALNFHPLTNSTALRVLARVVNPQTFEISYDADAALQVESIRLLDDVLATKGDGYVVVPVREGVLVPANSGRAFTNRFETYAYEGCHMAMFGAVREGAAALVTWDDPYLTAELRSVVPISGEQALTPTLVMRKSAKSFRVALLGKGDYVAIAKTYREIARQKGWLVTWDEKLKAHPDAAKLFGASNVKLWSTLSRSMNDESTKEESVRVSWTFDESAQVAEHIKRDLKIDDVLFTIGGWIHRGYDNQHPDILPTAPECGGDKAFADCAKRVMDLGYLFCLHDNYQDIYRDSPSWNERYIQKAADGALTKGGKWAGGRAYITCAKMALELAQRPQNLAAVRKLSGANSYFIDTTYAAGLQECGDKEHPLTRADDMKWKQALSDYARDVFGTFGSECGREWALPHADFFEGLTGVGGKYFHNLDPDKLGASVIPLFELVYRDSIAMYGKYGYDPANAAEYVLHHIAMGRPLHYHSMPSHLYWKQKGSDALPLRVSVAEFKQTAPRKVSLKYRWDVSGGIGADMSVFVHFTDEKGKIIFQGDFAPKPALSQWKEGEVVQGPFAVNVPANLEGTFDIRVGLHNPGAGSRPALLGRDDGEHRYLIGKLNVRGTSISFVAAPSAPASSVDRAVFCRAENGWAEGLHQSDRFLKNTHEILSPLNHITARVPMTSHEFLTADRKVQRTVFGDNAAEVIVNMGSNEFRLRSKLGGDVVLPALGFLIESPTFVAFRAARWNGRAYSDAPLFTLRSQDAQALAIAKTVRIFHAFGEDQIEFRGATRTVAREEVFR